MRLLWSNSFLYNKRGSEIYQITLVLSSIFEKLMRGNESLVLTHNYDFSKKTKNSDEKPIKKSIEKSIEEPIEKLIEEPIEKTIEGPIEKPTENLINEIQEPKEDAKPPKKKRKAVSKKRETEKLAEKPIENLINEIQEPIESGKTPKKKRKTTNEKPLIEDKKQTETAIENIDNAIQIPSENQKTPKPKRKVINEKPMTITEKKKLCLDIKKLNQRFLNGVLDIVKKCMDINGKQFEFDIDKLPAGICRELDKYVKFCIKSCSDRPKKRNSTRSKENQNLNENQLESTQMKIEELRMPQQVQSLMQNTYDEELIESLNASESEGEDEMELMLDVGLIPPNKEDMESLPRATNIWNQVNEESLVGSKFNRQNSAAEIIEIN